MRPLPLSPSVAGLSGRALLVACLAGLLVTPALGTSVLSLTTSELILRSDRIVHGTCIAKDSYRDERGRIVSRYSFRLAETLKGDESGVFVFTQLGGTAGDYTYLIPGLSEHAVGDECILFLSKPHGRQGQYRIPIGLDQGVFRVVRENGAAPRVTRRLDSLHLVSRSSPGEQDSDRDEVESNSGSPATAADLAKEEELSGFLQALRRRIAAENDDTGDQSPGTENDER